MQKSKIEIIKETAAFYGEDPSRRAALLRGDCFYKTEDGRMCAFGRCEIDPPDKNQTGGQSALSGRFNENNEILNEALRPEYRGHSINFWRDVQEFHDNSYNWDQSGLTKTGKGVLKNLLEKYPD